MAKRFADSQITRETFKENESGSDEETSGHKTASAAVMSKRKIAMPKRKIASFQSKQQTLVNEIGQPANPFSFAKNVATPAGDGEKFAKLKALNLQFKEKILSFIEKDPCADFSPVCKKYEVFIKTLHTAPEKSTQAKVDTPKPLEDQDSSEDEGKEVKIEGPKFTISSKPPTSDSVFCFGAKKAAEKDESDSDSDAVEIKGPQFTFSGTVKSDVFKLPTPANKENGTDTNKAESVESKTKSAFSFGGSTSSNTTTNTPKFNFSGAAVHQNDKSAAIPEQQKDDKDTKESKFDFSFGANKESSNETAETKKPFSFAFNSAPQEKKDETKVDAATPSFSFSKPIQTQEKKVDAKSSFSFGKPSETQEQKTETKPAFSFGKSADDKAESKPAFSFGKSSEDKAQSKPAFSFGALNSSSAPSFTFGKPEVQKDENKVPEGGFGAKDGFKFALPFEKKAAGTEADKKPEVVTPSTEEPTDNVPQGESKPIELQNGEEGETPLFSQRSKLMIFNAETKNYDSKGVGEMKLLQSKEDKTKVRFLCRSDGMGNILLNARIVKDFTYSPLTADNENLIKVPTIEADNKLITYVVKFKQKADGRQFVKTIEDAKKDL